MLRALEYKKRELRFSCFIKEKKNKFMHNFLLKILINVHIYLRIGDQKIISNNLHFFSNLTG